jgi:alpha-L-fucosidase
MKTRFISFLLLLAMSCGAFAQSSYQPTEENLKAREEFQDNKFGIFLHWGLYAMR